MNFERPGQPQHNEREADVFHAISPNWILLSPEALLAERHRLEEALPDDLETITSLFSVLDFLRLQHRYLSEGADTIRALPPSEQLAFFKDITECRFLITNFVIARSAQKADVERFWAFAKDAGAFIEGSRNADRLQRSTTSQAGAFKVLEALGLNPGLATPEEDAFKKIDIRTVEADAFQVKGTVERKPGLRKSKHITLPVVRTSAGGEQFFSANPGQRGELVTDASVMTANARAFDMRIPYGMIDPETGTPEPALVAYFARKLGLPVPA